MVFGLARDALRGKRHRFERTARGSAAIRKKMIDRSAKPSVSRQAIVPGVSQGSTNFRPQPMLDPDLNLMHPIDKWHFEFPFAGGWKL